MSLPVSDAAEIAVSRHHLCPHSDTILRSKYIDLQPLAVDHLNCFPGASRMFGQLCQTVTASGGQLAVALSSVA